MALTLCKECGHGISSKAGACPNCGAPQKSQQQYGCGTLILVLFVGLIFITVVGMMTDGSTTTSTTASAPSITIANETYADPSDVSIAKKYIAELPPACSDSNATVSKNGTVTIHTLCKNSDQSTDVIVKIKNGKVTGLR